MEATYQLNESEFDQNILEAIKTAFKNRFLKISITSDDAAINSFPVSMPYSDVVRLSNALDNDESIDLMAELEKFKILSK